MNRIAISIIISALAAPVAVQAQSFYTAGGGNVCLRGIWIDHTKATNDRTIVFYMKDNRAWVTHLKSLCPQLSFNGFSYVATPPDDICGNLQAIRVIRTGAVCLLDPFEPASVPASPDSGQHPGQHSGM